MLKKLIEDPEEIAQKLHDLYTEHGRPVILVFDDVYRSDMHVMVTIIRERLANTHQHNMDYQKGGGACTVNADGLCFVPPKLVHLHRAMPDKRRSTVVNI